MHTSTPRKRLDVNKTWWRLVWIFLIVLILLIYFGDVFQLRPFSTNHLPQLGFLTDFLTKPANCRIPDMDPFDPSIQKHIFQECPVVCNNGMPPLIESNLTSLYVLKTSLPAYNISDHNDLKCCYSVFKRAIPKKRETDNKVIFNRKCVVFNQTCVISDEFVRVICLYNGSEIYKDFFSFVPIKREVKWKSLRNPSFNVLVVGMDSVSRLNLHRQMPKTVEILKNLNGVELLGYNKVGSDTSANLIPVLTGLTEQELRKTCLRKKKSRIEDCPFLWKNYRRQGFSTVFGEDAAWMGIFNYFKGGFSKPPTNYFWGHYNLVMEKEIGNEYGLTIFQCVGARLIYNTLLEYINKFAQTMHMNKIPFFGFFWGSSLSRDFLNKPKLGDEDYANFLSNLKTSKILDDTVLIFMSDHGIRWDEISMTYQERMEENLPFLFIVLPQKYRDTFNHSYINLKENLKRLTTPFDLHETLKDLVDPALTKKSFYWRSQDRAGIQRGYSLFEPIFANRTCKEAGIKLEWCTCL